MNLTFKEQLILILDRRKMTKNELAKLWNTSRQNLYKKFEKNSFTEIEMKEICELLNLKYTLTIEE